MITAVNIGNAVVREAIRVVVGYLATGIALLIHVIDQNLIRLAGTPTQNNPLLLAVLRRQTAQRVIAWDLRRVRIEFSELGYHGGVLCAWAMARERITPG